MNSRLLVNPFEKIAGWTALGFGLLGIIISGLIADLNGGHFPDLITVLFSTSTGWHVPILELGISWVMMSIFGLLLFIAFRVSNFRVIDLIGTLAFAKLPYLLVSLAGFNFRFLEHSVAQPLGLFIAYGSVAWTFALTYQAFRVSGNLKGPKLWAIFLLSLLATELILFQFKNQFYLFIL